MRYLPVTPNVEASLPGLLTADFSADFYPGLPPVVAYATLTGLPGVPLGGVVPVVATVTACGLTLTDVNGYLVAASAVLPVRTSLTLPAGVAPEVATYYAGLGLLAALPSRLTFTAVSAAGLDFSLGGYYLPANGAATVPAFDTLPPYATGLTPVAVPTGYTLGGYAAGVISALTLGAILSAGPTLALTAVTPNPVA